MGIGLVLTTTFARILPSEKLLKPEGDIVTVLTYTVTCTPWGFRWPVL